MEIGSDAQWEWFKQGIVVWTALGVVSFPIYGVVHAAAGWQYSTAGPEGETQPTGGGLAAVIGLLMLICAAIVATTVALGYVADVHGDDIQRWFDG